jgi:hypothetical protein
MSSVVQGTDQRENLDLRSVSVGDVELLGDVIPAFLFRRLGVLYDLTEELNLLSAQGGCLGCFWWHDADFDLALVDGRWKAIVYDDCSLSWKVSARKF